MHRRWCFSVVGAVGFGFFIFASLAHASVLTSYIDISDLDDIAGLGGNPSVVQRLADGTSGQVESVEYWIRKSAGSASDIKLWECSSSSALTMSATSSIMQSGCSVVATATLAASLTEHPRNPNYPDTPIDWASSTFATQYELDSSKYYGLQLVQVSGSDCQASDVCLWGSAAGNYNYDAFYCTASSTSCTTEGRNMYSRLNGAAAAAPPSVSILGQFKENGTTTLGQGSTTDETSVVFKAVVTGATSTKLEVELKSYLEDFDGSTSSIYSSGYVSSSSTASTTAAGLTNGPYHWRGRAVTAAGATSTWTEFGTVGDMDFGVRVSSETPWVLVAQPHHDASVTSASSTRQTLGKGLFGTARFLKLRLQTSNSDAAVQLEECPSASYTGCSSAPTNALFSGGCTQPCSGEQAIYPSGGSSTFTFDPTKYYQVRITSDDASKNVTSYGTTTDAYPNGQVVGAATGTDIYFSFEFYRNPVVIVPGIAESTLVASSTGEEIWPNVGEMASPFGDDTYLDVLKLNASGTPTTTEIQPGRVFDSEAVPYLSLFTTSHFFDHLISNLVSNEGYASGTTLIQFPYDWRLDIRDLATQLGSVLRQAAASSSTGKVDVVAHSMGGLVLKQYLDSTTTASYIEKVILDAVPQAGAPKVFKMLNYGDDLGIRILNTDEAKAITQNMPAAYQLLPSRRYIQNNLGGYVSSFANGASATFDYDDTKQLMLDPVDPRNSYLLGQADVFHGTATSGLDARPVKAAHVYNILGCGKPTLGGFRVYSGKLEPEYVLGDGTVPLISSISQATGTTYYAVQYPGFFAPFTALDHTALISNSSSVDLIANILGGSPEAVPQPYFSTSTDSCDLYSSWIKLSTHSPVSVDVYDAGGNHTGPTSTASTTGVELGIPDSQYETIGHETFILLPATSTYEIVFHGTASGTFDFEMEKVSSTLDTMQKITYLDIPLQNASTTGTATLASFDSPPVLQMDQDGNGSFETTSTPTANLTGTSSQDIVPPVLSMPVASSSYFQFSTTSLVFSASDTLSGVASSSATLNGTTILSGQTITLNTLGTNLFEFQAKDNAGNPQYASSSFSVTGCPAGPGSFIALSNAASSIFQFDGVATSTYLCTLATSTAGIGQPHGMTYGSDGNLYFTNIDNNRVYKYDFENATMTPFITSNLNVPTGIALSPITGDLYVANVGTNDVRRFDSDTGSYIGVFASTGLSGPRPIAFDTLGRLYVGDYGNNLVRRYYSSGTPDGLTISVGEPLALRMSPDASSTLFIASDTDHKLYRYYVVSSTLAVFSDVDVLVGSSNAPSTEIALDENSRLYLGSRGQDTILRFASSTGAFLDEFIDTQVGGLDGPTGIGFRPEAVGGEGGETGYETLFTDEVIYLTIPMIPTPTSTEMGGGL